ncbi:MAG: DUF983 domain-containing protein [Pseudomonadota bacterium]
MATAPSVLWAGVRCRCPNCGEGALLKGLSEIVDHCDVCSADFSNQDSGDGPAFFVMFLVAILVTPFVLVLQIALEPPGWVQILVWSPIVIGLSFILLRPFKSILFALQWRHKAEEARWVENEDPD